MPVISHEETLMLIEKFVFIIMQPYKVFRKNKHLQQTVIYCQRGTKLSVWSLWCVCGLKLLSGSPKAALLKVKIFPTSWGDFDLIKVTGVLERWNKQLQLCMWPYLWEIIWCIFQRQKLIMVTFFKAWVEKMCFCLFWMWISWAHAHSVVVVFLRGEKVSKQNIILR